VNGKAARATVIERAVPMVVPSGTGESATLQYLTDWQETRQGDIAQGGQLIVQYDQARLSGCQAYHDGMPAWDSSATIRFHPSEQVASGPLVVHLSESGGSPHVLDPPQPVSVTASIPLDAAQAELWFERHNVASGPCQVWDSRFGQNYWYDVAPRGPTEQVIYRQGAIPDCGMVNVFAASAEKRNVFPQPPIGSRDGSDLRTFLHVTVWARNVAYAKNVWMDVHLFDGAGARIHAETFAIPYENVAGGNGDFFTFDGMVYQGTTATPGSVSPRPDARIIQFRVYYEVGGHTFTDAILHQQEVPEDAVIM
jgi:uncharacterized protein DUF6209